MKQIRIILLSLLLVMITSACCYATNDYNSTPKVDTTFGPIPIGKTLSAFLKPYIKKTVGELVKKGVIKKSTGKQLSKAIIGCTTITGICKLAKQQLDTETCIGMAKSGSQWAYENYIRPYEISTQVQNNMKAYLDRYKEEHQLEESTYNLH